MKQSENLVATLFAVYAIILVLCIAIYAIFKLLEVDITLATNLLLWSAGIFAPIAVLMTYTNWREQKQAELVSRMADIELDYLNGLMTKVNDLENKFRSLLCNNGITEDYKKEKIEFDYILESLNEFKHMFRLNRNKLNFFLKCSEKELQDHFDQSFYNYLHILIVEAHPQMMELMSKVDNERLIKASDEFFDNLKKYKLMLLEYIAFLESKNFN